MISKNSYLIRELSGLEEEGIFSETLSKLTFAAVKARSIEA